MVPRENIEKRIKFLGPTLLVLSIVIFFSGVFLQWRLRYLPEHPPTVALIGQEKLLVTSINKAAVNLLNLNDDKQAGERLRELRKAYNEWIAVHDELKTAIETPGLETAVIEILKSQVFPRFDSLVVSINRVFDLASSKLLLTVSELKPLVREVESKTELYMFFLGHLDLRLAQQARNKIDSLRLLEGMLVILAGFLLLLVVLMLFLPASKLLRKYHNDLNQLTDDLRQKNALLSELYFKVEKKAQQINDRLRTLAHEVRNPVGNILMSAELQKKYLAENDKDSFEKFSKIIMKSGRIALNTLEEFLDLTRIEGGLETLEISKIDTKEFIFHLEDQFKVRAERKHLLFSVEISKDCPAEITTDSNKLERIVSNLLSNAVKYTNNGSVKLIIQPSTDSIDNSPAIDIVVEDTGVGISEDSISQVFEPFVTMTKNPQSVGLGLAIVKKLVDILDGQLDVKSKFNQGSRFTVKIPIHLHLETIPSSKMKSQLEDEYESENVILAMKANEKIKNLKVLVVDNSPEYLDVTSKFLKSIGVSVQTSESAEEALKLLSGPKNSFDLVFMDLNLPKLNGIQIIEQIQSQKITTPVIAVTSFASKFKRKESLRAGFVDYVEKPLTSFELADCLIKNVHL